MHIVFLAWRDLANPLAGGSEILVDRLATGLAARGHRVTLIAGGPVDQHPYEVVDAGGVFAQYACAPWLAVRHHRTADLVVDVCNGMPFFSPAWRRGPSICHVNHVHTEQWGLWFGPLVAAAGRTLERRAVPAAYRHRLFSTISPSSADALVALGVERDRIRIVPTGVDLPAVRSRKGAEPLFVAVGRLVPHKRFDLLLELWRRVRPLTGGNLVIAGEGPDRRRLEAMAPPGTILPGWVDEVEKQRLLAEAWLLVHPSLLEGWGLVVMEAGAQWTPTLGFDVPGVRDSVVNGRSGILAASNDEFVQRWVSLAHDQAARTSLGRAARSWAAEFTWDRSASAFEAVAHEAVLRSQPTAVRVRAAVRATVVAAPVTAAGGRDAPAVSFIVPAFNEEARLARALPPIAEAAFRLHGELIVVDDGSRDATAALAREILGGTTDARVVSLAENRGKGAAIRRGIAEARGRQIVFMDADLATDLADLPRLLRALDDVHVAIGSRSIDGSRTVGGTRSRALMGRTFNRMARATTGMDIADFQCGFKAFRADTARLLFHLGFIDGYAFDVEILALAERIGYRVAEVPVSWMAVPGSHIRMIRDSSRMAFDLALTGVRWRPARLIPAVRALAGAGADPDEVVSALRPHVRASNPVVPWRQGALVLLPLLELQSAEALAASMRARLPHLELSASTLAARTLLHPDSRSLRNALAA